MGVYLSFSGTKEELVESYKDNLSADIIERILKLPEIIIKDNIEYKIQIYIQFFSIGNMFYNTHIDYVGEHKFLFEPKSFLYIRESLEYAEENIKAYL